MQNFCLSRQEQHLCLPENKTIWRHVRVKRFACLHGGNRIENRSPSTFPWNSPALYLRMTHSSNFTSSSVKTNVCILAFSDRLFLKRQEGKHLYASAFSSHLQIIPTWPVYCSVSGVSCGLVCIDIIFTVFQTFWKLCPKTKQCCKQGLKCESVFHVCALSSAGDLSGVCSLPLPCEHWDYLQQTSAWHRL